MGLLSELSHLGITKLRLPLEISKGFDEVSEVDATVERKSEDVIGVANVPLGVEAEV